MVAGEDVSENKDGSVLKSRIRNGQGINPPKDGAVCSGMYVNNAALAANIIWYNVTNQQCTVLKFLKCIKKH